MRKVITFVLTFSLCCLLASADALTVREFVDRYNENCGESYKLTPDWFPPEDEDSIWFLSNYSTSGDTIAVYIDRAGAENPMDYLVETIFVRHKPRTSVGRFMAMADLFMQAAFPEMPPEQRAKIILDSMTHSEILFGEAPENPIANNVNQIGQFVYQETIEYDTLLIPVTQR